MTDDNIILCKGLPFDILFEKAVGNYNASMTKGSVFENSGFVSILLDSLIVESDINSARHSRHILSRLELLLSSSVISDCTYESLETVMVACFQMLHKLISKQVSGDKDQHLNNEATSAQSSSIVSGKLELLESIVYHPAFHSWFLTSDEDCLMGKEQMTRVAETMTCCILEFLLVAVDCIGFENCKHIVQPFIDRLYQVAMDELLKVKTARGKLFSRYAVNCLSSFRILK